MKTVQILFAGALAAAAAFAETGPFGGENILANGGFETDANVPNGVSYGGTASTASWQIGKQAGLTQPGSWCSPSWMHFPDGSKTSAFIQIANENSWISQTFTAPAAGLYRLSFMHAARPGTVLGERVRVLVDGTDYGYATNWSMDFDFSTFDIPLSAGTHTLKLVGDQTGTSGDTTAVLDKFSLEIPAEPDRTLADIDNYAFRFDFSQGTKVVTGQKYVDDGSHPHTFVSADGPTGPATAAKYSSGWGTISDGDKSLNGDWSVLLSCLCGTESKKAIVSVGSCGSSQRKQLIICTEADNQMSFVIGQNYGSGRNIPSQAAFGGLVEPETRFHSVACVHRKESNYISCYIDGMLVGRLSAIYQCEGRTFQTGLQFNGTHGGGVSGVNGSANVPIEDFRFYERALSDADVALYAKTYPARRPSQGTVDTDVNPTTDTTYESDPTASGTLLVPAGVTITAPSLGGNYFNYGKIILTGSDSITAAPRGPGIMRFTGAPSLGWTSYGNSPVEIAGNATINNSAFVAYRSSPLTIESGTVTLNGQINLGDTTNSDYYDPLGSVVNFKGGAFAGDGFLYIGGRSTQNDINITSGLFTAQVTTWGEASTQGDNRHVNVSGTGVFQPSSLAYYSGSTDPGSYRRLTVRLHDGGTFTPPASWPAFVWFEAQCGTCNLTLASDAAPTSPVAVDAGATLAVGGAGKTFTPVNYTLDGNLVVTNGAAVKFDVYTTLPGAVAVAADAKLVLDLADFDGRLVVFTAQAGLQLGGDVGTCVEFVNAPAGYRPALGADGLTVCVTADDLTVPALAEWIGGGEAGKLDDPANWTCYNVNGDVLAGKIPTAQTYARVVNGTNFQLPYDAAATLAAMDASTADDRAATICGHIQYAQRAGFTDYSYIDVPYASYNPLGEIPITRLLTDASWRSHYLPWSQLRFDGWFKVSEAQAGNWTLASSFDDYYAMSFDGVCVLKNNTYASAATATCTMTAGWHRFTLIVGDTYGGWGCSKTIDGVATLLGVSINGAAEVPFETAFPKGTGPTQMWKKLTVVSCQLTADADWRGVTTLAEGAVVDLAGHKLTLDTLDGAAEITDTVGGGELHVAGAGINNTQVALTGQLRFVKEGDSPFWASKDGQSYTGGTEIQGGTFTFNTATLPAGARSSEIKIAAGATLEMNGKITCYSYDTAGTIHMATGTGSNGYSAAGKCFGPEFKLSGDAKVTGQYFYFGCPDQNPIWFTLNGHTLTLDFDNYVGIGTWRAHDSGTFLFTRGMVEWLAGYGPIGADVEVHSPATFKIGGNFDMGGLWYDTDSWSKNSGVQAHLLVYSTWQATAFRPPVWLANGSTLDLNRLSEPLDISGGDRTCDSGVNGYVSFAESGTFLVDVSKRKNVGNGTKVVSWDAIPDMATFQLNDASKKAYYWLRTADDGLYVGRNGIWIIVR